MFSTTFALLLGIIYGLVKRGKQSKLEMLKKAVGIGFIIGIILAIPAILFMPGILAIFAVGAGIIAAVSFILYFAIFFVVGVFIGDLIEGLIR
jgi:Mg/Co/Ni transporter MgtE